MLRVLSAGLMVGVAACASGASGAPGASGATGAAVAPQSAARCAPIVSDSLLGGVPVYPACGVGIEAKLSSSPMRPQYTAPRGTSCVSATLSVVVDAKGQVVPKTERLIRTNDPALYTAMLVELPRLRYRPAMRDGVPVAQLVEIGWIINMQVRQAGTLSPPARATRQRC
jgi:hypothetical protein